MSSEKSSNPISLRSRRWIIEALLELMEEKSYQKISIKEITERAGLVRKTFYRNFQSKEEILQEYINELVKEVEQQFDNEAELTPYFMAEIYFLFWQEHIHFLKLLQKNDLFVILLKHLDDYLPKMKSKYKAELISDYNDTYLHYYTSFNSAGIWHILEKWIGRGNQESPQQMAQLYSDIILNHPHMKKQ
ncbi:TetR/AcrR family transcriptional regulator [Bacillus sp. 2205SS5-2]|uniref:TetR/AcrR family transcriptional regulator n=1 Tax=Bacillus sp. 2205SS5-2 TaxID=3109031 RepID=UPI003006BFC0